MAPFRDAAKKFGWSDTKEEQRLEVEVAALREAIDGLRFGSSKRPKPQSKVLLPFLLSLQSFVEQRSPVEQIGIAAVAALAAFAVGFIVLAIISIPFQMDPSKQTHQVASEATQEVHPTTEISAPVPFDMDLLGPRSDTTSFNGDFEAMGFDPTWALQFSDDHATLEFRDGASHNSYGAQREVRSRGAQTIYGLGEPLAIVLIRHPCVLPRDVGTEFEVHVRSSLTTYRGCAARRQSEHWPPWGHYGSEFWRFQRRPFED